MFTPKFAARRRGFTLIELLIVIVVIAILALIVIPKLMGASRRAKDATLRANLHVIRTGIAQYEADLGEYPADLTKLYTAATGAQASMWHGPYGAATTETINGTTIPLPKNPYISGSTSVTAHWDYDFVAAEGTKPASFTLQPILPTGIGPSDAEGNLYSSY